MEEASDIAFFVIDSLLVFFIVFGNLGVLVIIYKHSKVKNSKNALLVSLAIADLCIGLFVIPNVMYMKNTNSQWKGLLCRLCLYFEYASNAASVLTLAALAVDRFRALMFPLKFRQHKGLFLKVTLVVLWSMAFLYGLRAPLIYDEKIIETTVNNITTKRHSCFIPTSLTDVHESLVVFDFVFIFGLPALALIVCNVSVTIKLQKKTTVNKARSTSALKRRKAIRLLLLMIIIFVVCHFPLYFLRMAKTVLKMKVTNAGDVGHICLIVSFLNSLLNIFFYGSLNDEIKAFVEDVGGRICGGKRENRKVHPLATLQTSNRSDSKQNDAGNTESTAY